MSNESPGAFPITGTSPLMLRIGVCRMFLTIPMVFVEDDWCLTPISSLVYVDVHEGCSFPMDIRRIMGFSRDMELLYASQLAKRKRKENIGETGNGEMEEKNKEIKRQGKGIEGYKAEDQGRFLSSAFSLKPIALFLLHSSFFILLVLLLHSSLFTLNSSLL